MIDILPRELANPANPEIYIPELIVVGAADQLGKFILDFSTIDASMGAPHLFAFGGDIQCARHDANTGFVTRGGGTSGGEFPTTKALHLRSQRLITKSYHNGCCDDGISDCPC